MELEDATMLFRGPDEKRRYTCRECANSITSENEAVRSMIGQSPFLIASKDTILYEFLNNMGVTATPVKIPDRKEIVRQAAVKTQQEPAWQRPVSARFLCTLTLVKMLTISGGNTKIIGRIYKYYCKR